MLLISPLVCLGAAEAAGGCSNGGLLKEKVAWRESRDMSQVQSSNCQRVILSSILVACRDMVPSTFDGL